MIHAPISITVPAGTDLFDLPGLVFQEADRAGIKLGSRLRRHSRPDQEKAPEALRKRVGRPGPGGRRHRGRPRPRLRSSADIGSISISIGV